MVDYDAWLRAGLTVDIVSGFVFLAFGAFAAFKRPRTRAGKAAGLFAFGWTLVAIYPNWHSLRTGSGRTASVANDLVSNLLNTAGFFLVAVGIVWLAVILCRGLPRSRTGDAILAILALDVVWTSYNSWSVAPDFGLAGLERVGFVTSNVLAGALTPLLVWLAVTVPDEGASGWVALAVTPLAGAWFLTNAVDFAQAGRMAPLATIMLTMFIGVPALARRRHPRLLTWTLAWWTASFLWGWLLAGHRPNDLGLIGATRILAVAVLVYAVVRHRAFDIDVKLRFTLRQSTIAGIFIAVFVGVQAAVGEYVTATAGILSGAVATTLLVFGLGPIQRFAERVAANAMPNAVPLDERSTDDRMRLYGDLAREAWSDGALSAKEARVLETAWRRLGLSAEQAAIIESRARS